MTKSGSPLVLIKLDYRGSRPLYKDSMATAALLRQVNKPEIRLASIKELVEFEQYCRAHATVLKVSNPELI